MSAKRTLTIIGEALSTPLANKQLSKWERERLLKNLQKLVEGGEITLRMRIKYLSDRRNSMAPLTDEETDIMSIGLTESEVDKLNSTLEKSAVFFERRYIVHTCERGYRIYLEMLRAYCYLLDSYRREVLNYNMVLEKIREENFSLYKESMQILFGTPVPMAKFAVTQEGTLALDETRMREFIKQVSETAKDAFSSCKALVDAIEGYCKYWHITNLLPEDYKKIIENVKDYDPVPGYEDYFPNFETTTPNKEDVFYSENLFKYGNRKK